IERINSAGGISNSCLESAIAVAQQQTDRAGTIAVTGALIGHREIELAISVEIARGHRKRVPSSGWVYGRRLKGTISVVQQYAKGSIRAVGIALTCAGNC